MSVLPVDVLESELLLVVVPVESVDVLLDVELASDSSHEATCVARDWAASLADDAPEAPSDELPESWPGGGPNMGGGGGPCVPPVPSTPEVPCVLDWLEPVWPSLPASCICSSSAMRSELSESVLDVVWLASALVDVVPDVLVVLLEPSVPDVVLVVEEPCTLASQA